MASNNSSTVNAGTNILRKSGRRSGATLKEFSSAETPLAFAVKKLTNPARSEATTGRGITLSSFSKLRVFTKRVNVSAEGSKATTLPFGPTQWENTVQNNPMFAPTSQ